MTLREYSRELANAGGFNLKDVLEVIYGYEAVFYGKDEIVAEEFKNILKSLDRIIKHTEYQIMNKAVE